MIKVKEIVALQQSSIKEVMKLIDNAGLRVAYIVNEKGKLVGVVSDSEIRKAILKGKDVTESVKDILNPDPVILREKDLTNSYAVKKKIKQLHDRMPDSRYILIVDKEDRPKKLIPCIDLTGPIKEHKRSHGSSSRHVLVVGGAGYLGSVLVRRLLLHKFKVKVLDTLMFGIQPIEDLLKNSNFKLIEGDMRNISTLSQALVDVDGVINLAAVVGDPACKNKPEMTIETNYLANKALAEACRYHQINRFIYASTCSVYGMMNGDKGLNEDSPLNPISLYARSKIQSEEGILSLIDENFSPTILRMGTLYGYSQRMRFDLVVNAITKTAVVHRKLFIHGDGRQWRPLLHVEDAAEAYIRCLATPISKIKGEIFNVGSREQNSQIIKIAQIVLKCIPQAKLIIDGEAADFRSYFVSFFKIQNLLKFKVLHGIKEGVTRIKKAIEDKEIRDVDDPRYYNVEYNK